MDGKRDRDDEKRTAHSETLKFGVVVLTDKGQWYIKDKEVPRCHALIVGGVHQCNNPARPDSVLCGTHAARKRQGKEVRLVQFDEADKP